MGIFSTTSPFDQFVERATSEKNTSEDWGQIMDICDRVKESNVGPRDCLKSIVKRLNNENPRVVLQAVTLLDACINNCGRKFLLEVASRDFEQELRKILTSTRTHHKVSERLRESLKKWADGEFKGDPQLSLMPALFGKLKQEGYDFNQTGEAVPTKKVVTEYSNDPNVVHSKQEEDDIARAIQLSLQEGTSGPASSQVSRQASPATGLYSSAAAVLSSDGATLTTGSSAAPQAKEALKARALYDFEAAEDNELTFKAGEIVLVQDNSDPNWWKGTNHRGEGLFPANFVTLDLASDTDQPRSEGGVKRVSFSECVEVTEVEGSGVETGPGEEVTGEVDEVKIDRLLHVLHEADPTGERPDPSELASLEEQVNAMAPTIDAELEQIDRQHAQLARISTGLVDALALYHQLMRDMPQPGYGFPGPAKSIAAPVSAPHQMPHPNYPNVQAIPPPQFLRTMSPQMYGGPVQFPPYMGTPGHFPPPGMPPTTATANPAQPPPSQPSQQPGVGPPAPHPGQNMPPPPLTQPSEFHQMQPTSHEGGMEGNMMPGYGPFPPSTQYAGPPSTHPSMPPVVSLPPSLPPDQHPGNFPIYSQPQTVQQPLL